MRVWLADPVRFRFYSALLSLLGTLLIEGADCPTLGYHVSAGANPPPGSPLAPSVFRRDQGVGSNGPLLVDVKGSAALSGASGAAEANTQISAQGFRATTKAKASSPAIDPKTGVNRGQGGGLSSVGYAFSLSRSRPYTLKLSASTSNPLGPGVANAFIQQAPNGRVIASAQSGTAGSVSRSGILVAGSYQINAIANASAPPDERPTSSDVTASFDFAFTDAPTTDFLFYSIRNDSLDPLLPKIAIEVSHTGDPTDVPLSLKGYWATGLELADKLEREPAAFSTNLPAMFCDRRSIEVSAEMLTTRPRMATHLVFVLDDEKALREVEGSGENNNVAGLKIAKGEIQLMVQDVTTKQEIPPRFAPNLLRVSMNKGPRTTEWLIDHPEFKAVNTHKARIAIQGPVGTRLKLKLYITPGLENGGHAHTKGRRPHGWLHIQHSTSLPRFFGHSEFQPSGETKYSSFDDALSVETSESGEAVVYYSAPEISGDELLWVSTSESDPAHRSVARLRLSVGIPTELRELQEHPLIERVGILDQHPRSHWATKELTNALLRLAQNYDVARWRKEKMIPDYPLAINDLSLPQGGLFDVPGSWDVENGNAHKGHRLGIEADIGGANKGHGLIPPNTVFDLMLKEQGWFSSVHKEGDHYHLVLHGSGKVAIHALTGASARWENEEAGILIATIPFENRGSINADSVIIDKAVVPGATIESVLPLSAGAAPVRSLSGPLLSFDLLIRLPITYNRKQIELSWSGYATGDDEVPSPLRFVFGTPSAVSFVRMPSPARSELSAQGIKSWSQDLESIKKETTTALPVSYRGTIVNDTGGDIYLSTASVRAVLDGQGEHEFELAPEFLATEGVIPSTGYAGPLFSVVWLEEPSIGSGLRGLFEISAHTPAGLPTLSAEFSLAYKPQSLSITHDLGGIRLSWNAESTNMIVETAIDLDGEESWLPLTNQVNFAGGTNSVTLEAQEIKQVFRLVGE